jgi:hypothetical protein
VLTSTSSSAAAEPPLRATRTSDAGTGIPRKSIKRRTFRAVRIVVDAPWADTPPPEAFLIRRHFRWFTHVIALVLLTAQFGLVVHASTHFNGDPDSQTAQVCDYCLTSTSLQNMGGGDASFVFAVTLSHDHAVVASNASTPAAAGFTAFRSRAPPRIL